MSSNTGRRLVPKFRFPGFTGSWEARTLGEVASFPKARAKRDEVTAQNYVSTENLLPEFSGVSQAAKLPSAGSGVKFFVGDILVSNIRPYLKKIWCASFDGSASNDVIVVRAKSAIHESFLSFVVMSEKFIAYVMTGAKGVKMPRGDIVMIKKFILSIPSTTDEQKSITDCLNSLDDLITAQAQKIEILKAHKKGLMQQLFPAEGETVPRLRFRDFWEFGDWQEKSLEQLSSSPLTNGVFNDPLKVGRGYKLINVSDMYVDGTICENRLSLIDLSRNEFEKNEAKYGDIFFTRSSLVKSGIAASNIYVGNSSDVTYDGHLIRLRPDKVNNHPLFINYLLKTEKVRCQLVAKGKTATMTTIGQADVATVSVLTPGIAEQIAVTVCLTALDELLIAHAHRLETLKAHKKGLMQGLFPALDGAPA